MSLSYRIEEMVLGNIKDSRAELKKIGCDKVGIGILESKAVFKTVKVRNVKTKAASLLKQTFLSKGGDAAVSRETASQAAEYTDVIIMATLSQYRKALPLLKIQPWGLKELAEQLDVFLTETLMMPQRCYTWSDGKQLKLDADNSLVMGILNVTPDSFSDGGQYNELAKAIKHVEEMQAAGADIIDIGAESTRPYNGSKKITAEEEKARLLPILKGILPHCSVPVSVDTYKADVADAALECGAHIINDIWGLQNDERMAAVAAKYKVPVIVMHNHLTGQYTAELMSELNDFFRKSIDIALAAGMDKYNIIIDPGIGFAKTTEENLYIMNHLEKLRSMECPILLAVSRKRFIGEVLDIAEPQERVMGTAAAAALGKVKGVQIHRVHDVKPVKELLKMMDNMIRSDSYVKNSNK